MSNQPIVFLAHANEDKERVRGLYKRLLEANIHPWLDEVDILPGQDWQLEISRALARSEYVIACISTNSVNKGGFVQKELRQALTIQASKPPGSIYLIPVVLDGSEVPDLRVPELGLNLRNIQWLDLRDGDCYEKLLRALGCHKDAQGPKAPMVEMQYRRAAEWPFKKPCPKCDGTMTLDHDMEEYACRSCDYWEYGP